MPVPEQWMFHGMPDAEKNLVGVFYNQRRSDLSIINLGTVDA